MFNRHLPPLERVFAGSRMRLLVLDRREVETVVPPVPYLVISIVDSHQPDAVLASSPLCKGVLRLRFDDLEKQPDPTTAGPGIQPEIIMSEQDAVEIVRFVSGFRPDIGYVVCHCEQGVSRSAGVAAALSRLLNSEDEHFFSVYWPNRLVYNLILANAAHLSIS